MTRNIGSYPPDGPVVDFDAGYTTVYGVTATIDAAGGRVWMRPVDGSGDWRHSWRLDDLKARSSHRRSFLSLGNERSRVPSTSAPIRAVPPRSGSLVA